MKHIVTSVPLFHQLWDSEIGKSFDIILLYVLVNFVKRFTLTIRFKVKIHQCIYIMFDPITIGDDVETYQFRLNTYDVVESEGYEYTAYDISVPFLIENVYLYPYTSDKEVNDRMMLISNTKINTDTGHDGDIKAYQKLRYKFEEDIDELKEKINDVNSRIKNLINDKEEELAKRRYEVEDQIEDLVEKLSSQ